MTSNPKTDTSFTFTTFRAYEAKVVLYFGLEAVFTLKTASKKGQLWQPSAAPFFDQMTPDQVHSGPKHVLYHHWEREGDQKKLTRPIPVGTPKHTYIHAKNVVITSLVSERI